MFFENHSKGVGDVYLNMYEKKTYIKKETVLEYMPFTALDFLGEKVNAKNPEYLLSLIKKL